MKWRTLLSLLVIMNVRTSIADAGNFWRNLGLQHCRIDCVGKWCCDDYCPKPEPCVCAVAVLL